jgi:cytosine/adenosine deaminase-related metal-dependent hydrolase
MTHLAETPGEVELLLRGTGPLREMLEHDIGVWDASTPTAGEHPVDFAIGPLARCRGIATHLNWIEPRHVELLGKAGVRVAHCPRASAAFGHAPPTLPTHPWRSLRDAGLIVGLGTDSLLCLDTPDRISVLDEMRLLATRDGVDPMTLLAMATIDGARVLDLDPSVASIGPAVAGLIACPAAGSDPYSMLQDVLSRREAPRWLLPPSARLGPRTVANT